MHVKICGLCRPEDAVLARDAGATHGGVIRVPGTPRWRPAEGARQVIGAAPELRWVGVFADADPASVAAEAASLGLGIVQLHGDEPPGSIVELKGEGLEVWKVVKPGDGEVLLEAATRYGAADLLLVEGAGLQGLGGVGARFDWEVVAAVRERLPSGCRLGVAGGLGPDNVAEAVARLRPALVDVSSGVEAAVGEKDPERVRGFVARAGAGAAGASAREEH